MIKIISYYQKIAKDTINGMLINEIFFRLQALP